MVFFIVSGSLVVVASLFFIAYFFTKMIPQLTMPITDSISELNETVKSGFGGVSERINKLEERVAHLEDKL
jgi:predicted PurR-regulated permease PerM